MLAQRIGAALPRWNLNALAEAVVFLFAEHRAEYEESLKLLVRDWFMVAAELGRFPELTVYSSQAGFLLVKLPAGVNGSELADYPFAERALLVRECGDKIGMTNQFPRVAVRPEGEVGGLVEGLRGFPARHRQWNSCAPSAAPAREVRALPWPGPAVSSRSRPCRTAGRCPSPGAWWERAPCPRSGPGRTSGPGRDRRRSRRRGRGRASRSR